MGRPYRRMCGFSVLLTCVLASGAFAADYTGGTLSLNWAVAPPSFMALDHPYTISVTPNYAANLPPNVERMGPAGVTYSLTWAATPDTDETWSGSGTSRDLTFHSTGAKTVTVTCTVSGIIQGVGLDGVFDTGDDTSYNISESPVSVYSYPTVFSVDITTPSSYPVISPAGVDVELECTVTPASATGGTYSWSVVSSPENAQYQWTSAGTAAPSFHGITPGCYTVKVEYTKSGSTASDTSGNIWFVGVKQVNIYQNATWTQVDGGADEVILKGTIYTFKAIKDPEDAPAWPSGKPTWDTSSGVSQSDNGDQTTVTFNSENDDRWVKAECGTSNKTATLDVIVPQLHRVRFTKYDIYDKLDMWRAALDGDTAVNDPACFKQGIKSTGEVKFFYTGKTLTFPTDVEIRGDVHWLDEYITGEDYGRDSMTMGTTWASTGAVESEANAEAAIKDDYDVDITWRYQVPAPNGTDDWIDTGDTSDLRYYLIWGDFACPAADFIDSRIAFLVDLAEGDTSATAISDSLGPDLTGSDRFGGNYWRGSDVWQILDNGYKGDCGTLATLMKYSLDLLGVTGSEVRFVFARHNSWTGLWNTSDDFYDNTVAEWRDTADSNTRLGYISGSWNNYEGCCHYSGTWWMGGLGDSRSSAYNVLMRVTQPNTSSEGQHQAYLDIQNTPVAYPAGTP